MVMILIMTIMVVMEIVIMTVDLDDGGDAVSGGCGLCDDNKNDNISFIRWFDDSKNDNISYIRWCDDDKKATPIRAREQIGQQLGQKPTAGNSFWRDCK